MQSRDAARDPLWQQSFDRRQAEDVVLAKPHTERVDQLRDFVLRSIRSDMPADGLPFDQSLDPGGGERGGLDAKAGIDHHEAFGEKFCEVLGFPIWPRQTNARGLSDVIHADKDQIEPPGADPARFEIKTKLIG